MVPKRGPFYRLSKQCYSIDTVKELLTHNNTDPITREEILAAPEFKQRFIKTTNAEHCEYVLDRKGNQKVYGCIPMTETSHIDTETIDGDGFKCYTTDATLHTAYLKNQNDRKYPKTPL